MTAEAPKRTMTLAEAFDLGYEWAATLYGSPQNLEDSRGVGRTLVSDLFEGLTIDLDGYDSFQDSDHGICEGKRRIKAALDRLGAVQPTAGEAES